LSASSGDDVTGMLRERDKTISGIQKRRHSNNLAKKVQENLNARRLVFDLIR
jgi:hypothetical protein